MVTNLRQFTIDNFPPGVRLIVYLRNPTILKAEDVGEVFDQEGKKVRVPDQSGGEITFTQISELLRVSEFEVRNAYGKYLARMQAELKRAASAIPTKPISEMQRIPLVPSEHIVAECGRHFSHREKEGFWDRYVRPGPVVDIGYSGGHPGAQPLFQEAIGLDLDTPGYNGRDFPYQDSTIGTIHGSHLLEHIADYQQFFREVIRVLMDGGTLILMVPLMDAYEARPVGPSFHNPDHKRFYTASRLCQEIELSLPRKSYRIIHLRENFNMADINRTTGFHAMGPSYEIECVIEKTTPRAVYGSQPL